MITRKEAENIVNKALAKQNWEILSPVGFTMRCVVEEIRQDMEATIKDAFLTGYQQGYIDSADGSYLDTEKFEDWLEWNETVLKKGGIER